MQDNTEDLENQDLTPPSGEGDDVTPEDNSGEDNKPNKKSAEARINELVSQVKSLGEQLKERQTFVPTPPNPTAPPAPLTPEVQKGIDYLKQLGFVQKEELQKTERKLEDGAYYNYEHIRLENKYDGDDGRPRYDRKQVDKYMRDHGVFDPEVAYKALYENELLDWAIKKAEGERKKKPFVQKPGSTAGVQDDRAITREKIINAQSTPEGRIWYEQNRLKIMEMMAKGQL